MRNAIHRVKCAFWRWYSHRLFWSVSTSGGENSTQLESYIDLQRWMKENGYV